MWCLDVLSCRLASGMCLVDIVFYMQDDTRDVNRGGRGQRRRCIRDRSPNAMQMGLHAFNEQRKMSVEEALPYLREQLYAVLNSEDAKEGLAAFFEKREPQWTGR